MHITQKPRDEDARKVIDYYLENEGLIPSPLLAEATGIPHEEIVGINRYLSVEKSYGMKLIEMGNGGYSLVKGVTKEWAYKVLGFTDDGPKVRISKKMQKMAAARASA